MGREVVVKNWIRLLHVQCWWCYLLWPLQCLFPEPNMVLPPVTLAVPVSRTQHATWCPTCNCPTLHTLERKWLNDLTCTRPKNFSMRNVNWAMQLHTRWRAKIAKIASTVPAAPSKLPVAPCQKRYIFKFCCPPLTDICWAWMHILNGYFNFGWTLNPTIYHTQLLIMIETKP